MESYCVRCKKYTKNINSSVSNTSNSKTMIYQNVQYVAVKIQNFLKNQEANGLLSSLGLKTPLSKVLLLGDILF